ncbi:M16 family metallopeptidase [Pseudomonas capsici]|uniref:Insulinase family protein n=1 Tax=Pseudomonas capsici TaxID=2810614 RepID=A0ABT3BRP8_9PSED|nr:M16 family metallopeptidase [Pseudomonas capsici]MCV4267214.1 insulinase family protein [Pseudomonas capsici]MCV4276162.1 insulinase family protein [Pseudomonas capsici]MCV4330107.1 insulinase family protein [Pseudomonas capsici]MCV4375042.1 insulinase family protein [Pseudomonas capsici]
MKKIIMSLSGLMLSACAQFSGSPQPQTWDPQVIRGSLSNGLEYRLVREASQRGRIDARLTVKAGSVDEEDDQVGVAHMVEHLNFYNRAGQDANIRMLMNQWGWAQGRNYNAMTNYDRTLYMLSPTGGAAQTEQALQALATLTLAHDYTADNLEQERPVVIEEWRGGLGVAQRMNDQRTASQRIGSRYPEHRTIGNEAAIRSATLAELQSFGQRWYVPNNMVLTIVGDIDPATLPTRIEHWFGKARPGKLPEKSYRELPLDNQLKIVRLQDSQSGTNQVALLFRLHEPASRAPTQDGLRERLIDRITLSALLEQLRLQPREAGVRSLTVQKSLIGDYSSVLGIAAGVEGDEHQVALKQLLTEIERVRRFGLRDSDMNREREELRAIAKKMLANDEPRSFEKWVTDLNDAANQNRVVLTRHDIATQYLEALDSIDLKDLNQRLKSWTDSQDRVLQLSAPGLRPLTLPTVEAVNSLLAHIQSSPLDAPQTETAAAAATPDALPALPAAPAKGQVLKRKAFAEQNVEYWQLSNGDRLVWLKRNGDNGRLEMKADSSAGFMTAEIPAWRSQMATQLTEQSAPQGWNQEQINRWRKEQGVSLSLDQEAARLQLNLSTNDVKKDLPVQQRLQSMLQAYRLSQSSAGIDSEAFEQARDELIERQSRNTDNIRELQDKTLRKLQYGQDNWQTPTIVDLQHVQTRDLDNDWKRLSQAPVTYYLMADIDASALQPLVEQELAGIPRGKPLKTSQQQQLSGYRAQELAIGIEPRAMLYAFSYHPRAWTPVDAARIATLRDIALAALKQQLRGEASGVYRLNFDSTLNQQTQRIESSLNFSSDPARVEELWQLARTTLAGLSKTISEKDIVAARKNLIRQEKLRRDDPQTQMRRLILSDRYWGDPRYLSQQQQLLDALTVPALKRLAGELFDRQNLVQFRLLPAPKEAVAGQ